MKDNFYIWFTTYRPVGHTDPDVLSRPVEGPMPLKVALEKLKTLSFGHCVKEQAK